MPCGAADTCKSFGVLRIEEKERRTQGEVFTATDRTGSGEGGCHRERRAASAHAQSLGSEVQLLGDMAAAYLLCVLISPPRMEHVEPRAILGGCV